MGSKLRIVTILLGAAFTLQGIGWLVVPDRAAAGLGMPVLDGLARSMQFGDFAAFFFALRLSILLGTRPGRIARINGRIDRTPWSRTFLRPTLRTVLRL